MDTYDQRLEDFSELYDCNNDPGVTLAELVRAAGDFLSEIVGPEDADPAMRVAISSLTGGETGSDFDWRDGLEEGESGIFSEWPMGTLLHVLCAYGQYGIDIMAEPGEDETSIEARITDSVAKAEGFLSRCPLEDWLGPGRTHQLERTMAMARGRLALDRGKPIEPSDLAELGNISQSRMRSLVAGKNPELRREEGKIPAQIALLWLKKHDSFLPSIWRDKRPTSKDTIGSNGEADHAPIEALFVPRAKDGSIFHPGLWKSDGFRIGRKGEEETVGDFLEALAKLQSMPVPYWRRPSETSGTPAIVRGESWVRKSVSDFAGNL